MLPVPIKETISKERWVTDTALVNATEDEALHSGKLSIAPHKPLVTQRDLSLAYSPGVAYLRLRIQKDPSSAFDSLRRAILSR